MFNWPKYRIILKNSKYIIQCKDGLFKPWHNHRDNFIFTDYNDANHCAWKYIEERDSTPEKVVWSEGLFFTPDD